MRSGGCQTWMPVLTETEALPDAVEKLTAEFTNRMDVSRNKMV